MSTGTTSNQYLACDSILPATNKPLAPPTSPRKSLRIAANHHRLMERRIMKNVTQLQDEAYSDIALSFDDAINQLTRHPIHLVNEPKTLRSTQFVIKDQALLLNELGHLRKQNNAYLPTLWESVIIMLLSIFFFWKSREHDSKVEMEQKRILKQYENSVVAVGVELQPKLGERRMKVATGIVVAKDIILTPAHTFRDDESCGKLYIHRITVLHQKRGELDLERFVLGGLDSTAASILAWGLPLPIGTRVIPVLHRLQRHQDIVLLKLNHPIPHVVPVTPSLRSHVKAQEKIPCHLIAYNADADVDNITLFYDQQHGISRIDVARAVTKLAQNRLSCAFGNDSIYGNIAESWKEDGTISRHIRRYDASNIIAHNVSALGMSSGGMLVREGSFVGMHLGINLSCKQGRPFVTTNTVGRALALDNSVVAEWLKYNLLLHLSNEADRQVWEKNLYQSPNIL